MQWVKRVVMQRSSFLFALTGSEDMSPSLLGQHLQQRYQGFNHLQKVFR